MKPSEYAKASVGAVVAGLTSLATAMDAEGITGAEWVGIAVVTLSTFGTVFATPNADPLYPKPRRRHEVGQTNVLYVLAVVFVALLVAWLFLTLIGAPIVD